MQPMVLMRHSSTTRYFIVPEFSEKASNGTDTRRLKTGNPESK